MHEKPLLLLIDDDPPMVHALSTLFREEGYEIRAASTGAEGVRIAGEIHPDLVILDAVMPGIDGLEVCRRLRQIPDLDETVIVHISAHRTTPEAEAAGLAAGADAYISLPIENHELVARINALLRLRQTEQSLQQSEQRYQRLIESIPQLVWTCDPVGENDYFSRQWRLYTGMDQAPEQISWFDAVDRRDVERTRAAWEQANAETEQFEIEHRLVGVDRSSRWFKTRGVRIREEGEEEGRWLLTATDIDELFESQEKTREANEELERTLEDLARVNRLSNLRSEVALALASSGELDDILQRCAEIICDYLDAAFVRIWKYKVDEKLLRLLASAGLYTHLDGPHSCVRPGEFKIGRIASNREPHLTNDVVNDPEISDPQWAAAEGMVSFAGFPLLLENRLVGVLALFSRRKIQKRVLDELPQIADMLAQFIDRKRVDRERRERMEEILLAHEEIETLIEVGRSVSAELDVRKLVSKVTDAATKLTKAGFGAFFYNMEDRHGERYQLYSISGVPEEAFSKFPMPRKTQIFGPTFDGVGIVRSDDITKDPRYGKNDPYYGMPKGHLPVVSYLAVPVISRTGEVIGGLFFGHPEPGVFTDREEKIVTSLASQAAIAMDNARLFNELELKVSERTHQLEESLSELEAFSYTVSHDLRAPLRVMQSYAQIIREDFGEDLDQTVIDYLERIAAAGSRLDRLILDLLTYSRVSRSSLVMQPIELEPVIEDVLSGYPDMQHSAVIITVDSPLPKVMGDKSSLTQCFSNLIGNAVKFVPEERNPEVRITGEVKGRHAVIRVSDNGIGIPAEHRERIFRIFERATPGNDFEGTGIGLAIVKKAMDRMGGEIDVFSGSDEGATFELRFLKPEGEEK